MCKKECFSCHYGQCLNIKDNTVPCKLSNNLVPNTTAKTCEDFIPAIQLGDEDIEAITEFEVHHKCPYCGNEDSIYDADAEAHEIIECAHCGKKYAVYWCIY